MAFTTFGSSISARSAMKAARCQCPRPCSAPRRMIKKARLKGRKIALEIDHSIEFALGIDAAESFVNAVGAAAVLALRRDRLPTAFPDSIGISAESAATFTGPTSASIARRQT